MCCRNHRHTASAHRAHTAHCVGQEDQDLYTDNERGQQVSTIVNIIVPHHPPPLPSLPLPSPQGSVWSTHISVLSSPHFPSPHYSAGLLGSCGSVSSVCPDSCIVYLLLVYLYSVVYIFLDLYSHSFLLTSSTPSFRIVTNSTGGDYFTVMNSNLTAGADCTNSTFQVSCLHVLSVYM